MRLLCFKCRTPLRHFWELDDGNVSIRCNECGVLMTTLSPPKNTTEVIMQYLKMVKENMK